MSFPAVTPSLIPLKFSIFRISITYELLSVYFYYFTKVIVQLSYFNVIAESVVYKSILRKFTAKCCIETLNVFKIKNFHILAILLHLIYFRPLVYFWRWDEKKAINENTLRNNQRALALSLDVDWDQVRFAEKRNLPACTRRHLEHTWHETAVKKVFGIGRSRGTWWPQRS